MHLESLESTQACSELSPRAALTLLSCSPNFPRASITRYTHAKHEPILYYGCKAIKALYFVLSHNYYLIKNFTAVEINETVGKR